MARYKVEINGIDTSKLQVIKNDEMNKLLKQHQETKDEQIKEILVMGNLRLVLSMVQRFSHRCDNMDDLFQIGCIGLIKAIDNFDTKHEVRFSTYAVPMILGEIKRYLRDNQMLKVSRNLKDLAYHTLKIKEEYIHTHQCEPTNKVLAQLLNVTEKEINTSMDALQSVMSISEPIYNDSGDSMFLSDQIKDEKDDIMSLIHNLSVKQSLKKLNTKELDIINKRYFKDQTQTEIAQELGISQAQVSRLEKSALHILKKNL